MDCVDWLNRLRLVEIYLNIFLVYFDTTNFVYCTKNNLCAFNENEWKEDKIRYNCTGKVNVYHCVLDDKGRSGEICIEKTWVQPGFCPVYNNDANTIDIIDCERTYGLCPDVELLSDKIYEYPGCLNQTYDFGDVKDEVKDTISTRHIVGPALGAAVLIILVLLIIVYFIRRRKGSYAGRSDTEENIPLTNKSGISDFYQTHVYQSGLNILKNNRFLCLIGKWGCGKTKTAKEICKSMTSTRPFIVQDVNEMNKSIQEAIVVFDDVMKEWYDEETLSKAKEKLNSLYQNGKGKVILVFTISISVWDKMKSYYMQLDVFTDNIESNCVLNFNDFPLTQTERDGIFYKCMEHNHLNANDFRSEKKSDANFIEAIKNPQLDKSSTLGFPEMCMLACKNDRFRKSKMFPNLPFLCIKQDLEWLSQSDVPPNKSKFLTLVYMALNSNTLDFKNINKKLARVFESHQPTLSNFNEMNSRNSFPEEYVINGLNSGEYVLQHDVIQKCVLVIYGTYHFSELLQYTPLKCLKGWIKQESKIKTFFEGAKQGDWKPVLYVSDEKWELYVKKIVESEEG